MSCARGPLYPLDEFYLAAGHPPPEHGTVPGDEVPEPYRQLLVHDHDMTPTLEAYFGDRIYLDLLARRIEGDSYAREVALLLRESGRRVEFGAIVIHCEHFPSAAREVILGGRVPLGTILAEHAIRHASRPQAFLRVRSDATINRALGIDGEHILYGRRNALCDPEGRVLADVLEILPPLGE